MVSFEVSGRENIPGILGARATLNFTYLVGDPLAIGMIGVHIRHKYAKIAPTLGESMESSDENARKPG